MLTAKIFTNGASQAVRLPKECRFSGSEVIVKPMGTGLMLYPKGQEMEMMLDSLNGFTEDYFAAMEDVLAERINNEVSP